MVGKRLQSPVHSIRSALLELLESRKTLLYVIMQWKSVFHFQFADQKPQSTGLRLKMQENVWVCLHSKKRATLPVSDSWKKRRKIYLKQKLKRWKQVGKWFIETHFMPFSWRDTESQKDKKMWMRYYYKYLISGGIWIQWVCLQTGALNIVLHCYGRWLLKKVFCYDSHPFFLWINANFQVSKKNLGEEK